MYIDNKAYTIYYTTNLTSIKRTRCVSGNRSQTLLFIFSLMMNEWQVRQSPIFMALLAATTCSLMLSGGPGGQTEGYSYPLFFLYGFNILV